MLGIASLVLIAFAGLSYRQWERYRRVNADIERSREALAAVNGLLATLADAESGVRGFMLTDRTSYLEPYNRALEQLPSDLAALKRLLSSTSGETKEFVQLNSLANQKMDELRQTVDVDRTQGIQAALSILRTDQNRQTTDAIRALCSQIQRDEGANQARASAGGEAAAGFVLLATVVASLVLLFLFAFGLEPFASPDPHAWRRTWPLRYGAAFLSVAAIALLRAVLTPLIGATNFPFTLFFCAVMFAAWFGGLRPALLAIVLSLLAGSWFFAAPTKTLLVSGRDDQVAMLMIVLVGFGTALLSRSQRNAVERALLAEKSERDERQRFETTLASIGDAVIATDGEGRITFANKVALALLKCPEAQMRGQPLDDIFKTVNEFTRAPIKIPIARAMREGEIVAPVTHTVLISRDRTEETPIDHNAAPILNSEGTVQGAVLVFRDVSGRRKSEKQLAEQALLLEKAFSDAQSQRQRLGIALIAGRMGVYDVKPIENIFWWSTETYSLFGVNPVDFKPTRDSFAALIHPGDRETFMKYWDENIATYQPLNHEFRILTEGAKERWISCRGMPKYDDSGLPMHYSGLFLDITERKAAEQVRRQFEKLSAAARLSAAIAHEINNPLGAVTNLIYLANTVPGVPESVMELLTQAQQELERIAHATRQALGFYRESSRSERLEVPELLESVLKIFSPRIEGKKIKTVTKFRSCEPVYGVRGEIRQVISNLLINAIEAVPEGGTISLETRSARTDVGSAIEILVADDGHGIAGADLDHIFEPFFTTKAGTGTGLGLWVAKEIIERHQGSIEVRQANGGSATGGVTFIVRLPSS